MPVFDDLTSGLKAPMQSSRMPSTQESQMDSGQPTERNMSIPEDGDTKSADPESWMSAKDFRDKDKSGVTKRLLLELPGVGISVFEVNIPGLGVVENFIDSKDVPAGEVWVNRATADKGSKEELLKAIIYCFLVEKDGYVRDEAQHIVDTIVKALGAAGKGRGRRKLDATQR